jgi:hypothetical protein
VVVGFLAISAAAWVRSTSVARGMLASIGIVIGALAVAAIAILWANVVDALGVLPWATAYAVAALPVGVGFGAAAIMWRRSARPWDEA